MNRIRNLQRWIIFGVLCSLLFSPTLPVLAQELTPQKVIATYSGLFPPDASEVYHECDWETIEFRLEVWNVGSAGGTQYAEASLWIKMAIGFPYNNCEFTGFDEVTSTGTFTGGPNGVAAIDYGLAGNIQFVDGQKAVFHPFFEWEGVAIDFGTYELAVENPDAFFTVPVTSEYIFNTYGIRVEDSFGDDQWEKTAWTDRELVLLDEVLRELPPSLIKKMALTKIVRNKTNLDKNGNPKPNTFGLYTPCVKQIDPDCNGSSATIRIFDQANNPFDFANDPTGDKEFKGTILHEMTHALQYHRGDSSTLEDPLKQKNGYSSPLMQNYMDATRPITDMNNPGFWVNNGWLLNQETWTSTGAPGNQAPTDYAGKNPKEDLCESMILYVYEPQKLQNSSPQRYNFIRDQMFGGIEYENGSQKQP